jgi:hypothetical protein
MRKLEKQNSGTAAGGSVDRASEFAPTRQKTPEEDNTDAAILNNKSIQIEVQRARALALVRQGRSNSCAVARADVVLDYAGYEADKSIWSSQNPNATPAEHEQAMYAIARARGV